jgi:hypothetical protein
MGAGLLPSGSRHDISNAVKNYLGKPERGALARSHWDITVQIQSAFRRFEPIRETAMLRPSIRHLIVVP